MRGDEINLALRIGTHTEPMEEFELSLRLVLASPELALLVLLLVRAYVKRKRDEEREDDDGVK
jgi:hypothetical protein